MKFGQLGSEADRLGRLLTDFAEFGEEEVCRWIEDFVTAPSVGFGTEGGRDGVDGGVRFVLTAGHEEVAFAGRYLPEGEGEDC